MKLRLVTEVDFRKSEATNFVEVQRKEKLNLGQDDVICLLNKGRTQVVFVWKPFEMDISGLPGRFGETEVIRSTRLRLSRSTWNPLMLQNYANSVGVSLDNIKRFEVIFGKFDVEGVANGKRAAA